MTNDTRYIIRQYYERESFADQVIETYYIIFRSTHSLNNNGHVSGLAESLNRRDPGLKRATETPEALLALRQCKTLQKSYEDQLKFTTHNNVIFWSFCRKMFMHYSQSYKNIRWKITEPASVKTG